VCLFLFKKKQSICMEEKAEQIKALLIKQKAFVEEAC
jgi:hypothetical protein